MVEKQLVNIKIGETISNKNLNKHIMEVSFMGLIKCPDCGKMVSTRVTACPNCGCPSEYFGEESSENERGTSQTSSCTDVKIDVPSQVEIKKVDISEPLLEDDIKFKFGKHVISYPKSTESIANLYGKYVTLARDYSAKYVDLYNSAGDMHTVLTSLTDKAIADIVMIEDMAAKDLYGFGISITRKDFDSKYVPGFKNEIDSLFKQYASVEQEKDDLEYQRQVEKASRGRWQGGGFGMKGAIKGAMNAAVLNAGSGLLHSIGDGFTKSGDRRYINNRFETIYASEQNRNEFVLSVFYCIESILEGIKIELANKNIIDINIFGDYDNISSTYETAVKYEKSADLLFEKLVECIKTTPEEVKYYEPIINELFKNDCELEQFLKFWNLGWVYSELQEELSLTLMKSIKSEFVSNQCSCAIKIVGNTSLSSEGVLVHGQVIKGTISANDEISVVKKFSTPIINARIIKILCSEGEVTKTCLGCEYDFILSLKNNESIAQAEILVDASSYKKPESNLYASYVSEDNIIDFDFANKYCGSKSAWYTFIEGDSYVSNRDISFSNSKTDIIKTYGETPTKIFVREKDALLDVARNSSDISQLETAKEYIQYRFGDMYAMRFYFDEKAKLLLVAYLKNLGLSNESEDSKEIQGFDMQIECSKCGKIISSDIKFCNFCGEPSPKFMKKCPSCDKLIKKETKFCNFCGYSFEISNMNNQHDSNENTYHVECEWDAGREQLELFVSDTLKDIEEFISLYNLYSIKDCAIIEVIPDQPLNGIYSISFFEVADGNDNEIYLETHESSSNKNMGKLIQKSDVEKIVGEFISGKVLEGKFEESPY